MWYYARDHGHHGSFPFDEPKRLVAAGALSPHEPVRTARTYLRHEGRPRPALAA